MPKSKIFFWLLAAFVAGVALASFLPFGPVAAWAAVGVGGAAATFGMLRIEERGRVIVLGVCLIAFAAGAIRFTASLQPPPVAPEFRRVRLTFEGLVVGEPVTGGQTQRVIVRERASGARALAITRPFPEYRYGDVLRLQGQSEAPESAFHRRERISLIMPFPTIELLDRDQGSAFWRAVFRLKTAFGQAIGRSMPEPGAAFMSGLLLGEREDFPDELTEALRRTGTAHLVALSGYNIAIIADSLLAAFLLVALPLGWAMAASALGIVTFTLATGAAASAVRAAVMGVLVLVARRAGRPYQARNAIALAAAGMLAADPFLLRFDLGFALSFLATLGLLYAGPAIEEVIARLRSRAFGWRPRERDPHKRSALAAVIVPTIAAQFAVLPLIVWRFGQVSIAGPLANVAVAPFIPLTMFAGFLTGVLGLFSGALAALAGAASSLLTGYELGAIALFSRPRAAALDAGPAMALVFTALWAFIIWRLWRYRRRRHAR